MRSAIGLIAGPDNPPKIVAIWGRRVRASMAIPVMVLMIESPSAPPSAHARANAPASATAATAAKDPSLARERTLLDMARTALSRGDASGALGSLDTHAREFPSSQLAEEREVLAIQALASAGRASEARKRAAAFRTRFVNSPLLPIVDEATQ